MSTNNKIRPPEGNESLQAAWLELEAEEAKTRETAAAIYRNGRHSISDRDSAMAKCWNAYRFGPLKKYAALVKAEAEKELPAREAAVKAVELDAVNRQARLGNAIGSTLKDSQAGADLAALLVRLGGGLVDQAKLSHAQSTLNAWQRMNEEATAILAEKEPVVANTENNSKVVLLAALATVEE